MGIPRLLRRLGAIPAFLTLAGCGLPTPPAAPPDAASLRAEPAARRPRGCVVDRTPAELPPPRALVDTTALVGALAELNRRPGPPTGYALLSMGYAPDGANIRRELIEHSVPRAVADSLRKLVFAHRRILPPATREWGVRLRVELGETPGFRVERREVCPPRPRDQVMLSFTGWSPRPLGDPYPTELLAGGYNVWVHLHLNELGQVMDARLERGLLRRGVSENLFLNQIRAIDFHPALEDGRPVPSEVSVPIRVPA
ncbi:MAG TPA: hypothetical protein VHG28_08775 [Longimicrobiaceae bacterium]|nr:hypothetical protein [Longimicrobiaceae bacterium]